MSNTKDEELTADEIALYDRQIRLWGMATQLRLRSTKILVINLGAIGSEAVKNLVLGGINSIEILDPSYVKIEDFTAQFFLPNDESIVGQLKLPLVFDKIRELNPAVNLSINTNSINELSKDYSYLKKFDLIIGTELTKSQIFALNQSTRELNIPLYISGMHGMFGYILVDLIKHVSVNEMNESSIPRKAGTELSRNKTIIKVDSNKETKIDLVTIEDIYSTLKEIFNSKVLPTTLKRRELKKLDALTIIFALFDIERLDDSPESILDSELLWEKLIQTYENLGLDSSNISKDYFEEIKRQAFAEFSPTAAILGGTLAQDVIQYLSKNHSPINNVLILDAKEKAMPIYSM
ncbi:AOS1 [Candida pseudojiufengensis]|uniref:AOS1 n=1 Tax=Candida pseudojiufengensis TaxID=497109 RepID=UPI0022252F4A|nr:AOS1 [Candida pseudojiufengensis]KAI5961899.1 AOS1 [Candida pseudojiufengensis]